MISSTAILNAEPRDNQKEKWHKIIMEPIRYIEAAEGKDIRGKLVRGLNPWLEIPEDRVDQIAKLANAVHETSLLIDDIEDGSVLRRGCPVAHSVFGITTVVNAAMYSIVGMKYYLEDIFPDKDVARAVNAVYHREVFQAIRGQGKELYWREFCICPTEEEYKKMVLQKVGSLFFLISRTMQLFSRRKMDLTKLIESISLHCQIQNDYLNLACEEYFKLKSYCDDLSEGKFNFVLIHAININPIHKEEILDIVKRKPTDYETKRRCVKLLEDSGSIEYTERVIAQLEQDMLTEITNHGGNESLKKVLLKWFAAKV